MAVNYIFPFAQGGGALVQDTPTFSGDSQRPIGNQPGVARPDFVNKALKQALAMAVGFAQFLADNQGTDITDDLLGPAISTMLKNAVKAAAQSPAGTIVWVPGSSPLTSTVKINGALLTRATYPNLYGYGNTSGNMAASDGAWISGQFSPGDGTSTFRVPDLRGYHLRAWDDGRGIDASRTIGSVQADQLLIHNHGVTDPGHAHGASVSDPSHVHAGGRNGGQTGAGPGWGSTFISVLSDQVNTGAATTGITVGIATGFTGISINNSSGGSEVRVKNIALLPLIYY